MSEKEKGIVIWNIVIHSMHDVPCGGSTVAHQRRKISLYSKQNKANGVLACHPSRPPKPTIAYAHDEIQSPTQPRPYMIRQNNVIQRTHPERRHSAVLFLFPNLCG
jgi:hypothetical protein